ncbi:hypothetical protein TNCT_344201 [Trichonephila clavata]|uniref:Uncharacterized protein n=1 Tax=Trichonephila clavata TaxID=2740835 RepID=A0A8X6FS46_TRICU|nr:hypothetical protein TNCT_344201 [Trichonephila clavata]
MEWRCSKCTRKRGGETKPNFHESQEISGRITSPLMKTHINITNKRLSAKSASSFAQEPMIKFLDDWRSVNTQNSLSSHFNGGFSNEKSLRDNWILHPDNASSHTALIVSELLSKMGVGTLPQLPYSSDLATVESIEKHNFFMICHFLNTHE